MSFEQIVRATESEIVESERKDPVMLRHVLFENSILN